MPTLIVSAARARMLPSVIALVKTAPVPWRIVRRENMTFSLYRALLTGTRLWLRVSRSPDQLGSAFLVSSRDRLRFGSGSNSWRCNIRFISLRRKAANLCPDPIAVFCPKAGKTFFIRPRRHLGCHLVYKLQQSTCQTESWGRARDATAHFPRDATGLSNSVYSLGKAAIFRAVALVLSGRSVPVPLAAYIR